MPKLIDLTGQKFGHWTVIKRAENKGRKVAWTCRCDCGTEKDILGESLRYGKSTSCGCSSITEKKIEASKQNIRKAIQHNTKDLTGQKFNKLTVLKQDNEKSSNGCNKWICKCECGNICSISTTALTKGYTKSCGCLRIEQASKEKGPKIDLVGKTFGLLTVLSLADKDSHNCYKWLCKCECGNYTEVRGSSLIDGNTKSCGLCSHESFGIKRIKTLLDQQQIPYEQEKYFEDFYYEETLKPVKFDLYVNKQYVIEFDGRQHFEYDNKGWNNKENLLETQRKDKLRDNYCIYHNIPIIRIPYYNIDNISISDLIPESSQYVV